MKGMWASITSLVILIAAVTISLMVVYFIFSFAAAHSNEITVTQVSPGIIEPNGTLIVCLKSTSSVEIVKLRVNNYNCCISENINLTEGINKVYLTLPSKFSPVQCSIYTFTLILNNGNTVVINGKYS
jgi:hypothetical protein